MSRRAGAETAARGKASKTAPAPDTGAPPEPAPLADWPTLLAQAILAPASAVDARTIASLWADHATGDTDVDTNRLTILGLLARRQGQAQARPPAFDLAPLPAWPDPDLSPVPALHPTGLPGCSLISLCRNAFEAEALLDALPNWLAAGADEVLLIDSASQPILADRLLAAGTPAPAALRVVEVAADVRPSQGWNLGLRLAQFQRLICLGPFLRLPEGHARRPGPRPGRFGCEPGALDGLGFFLDIDRADIVRVGGFHEALPSADFALDDLQARLMASGLAPERPEPGPQLPASPVPPGEDAQESLGQALSRHPALQALANRHLAALLPDWTGQDLRGFAYAGPGKFGPRLTAAAEKPSRLPSASLCAEAQRRALGDLIAARLGLVQAPEGAGLDRLLTLPCGDVTAMDAAVAASLGPDLPTTAARRAWLAHSVAPEIELAPESPAWRAFEWLSQRAEDQRMRLVLVRAANAPVPGDGALAALPGVPDDPSLTRGFWPVTLRDLTRDHPLPHASLRFDADFLADHARFIAAGPVAFLRRPKLFVDAQHGLGNRLRAMASAAAIAEATGRELIVVWQSDAHCDCRFDDLFQPEGAVLDEGFAPEAESLGLDVFNYMEIEPGSAKDAPIRLSARGDAYLRSAYPLVHPASTWHSENAALRRFKPNLHVLDLVRSLGPAKPALSVHIRMEGGRQAEHLAYEAPANWTAEAHRTIDLWRRRSHFGYFQARIDQLLAEGLADSIFLASDTPEAIASLTERYGARLSHLPRPANDRSAPAMVHALADALLLARAPRLLGSTWSSFSELAARLATHAMEVELSGRDF